MNDQSKYGKRADRMVERWCGSRRQPNRSQETGLAPIHHRDICEFASINPDGCKVVEPRRSIPVLDRCDVLVVGGGPAGISAALAARRAGADTILMERFGTFGGVITTVGMETLAWYRYEGTIDAEGVGMEMERLAVRMGGTVKWPYNDSKCLDADVFKVVADHLLTEAGVRPLLHTTAVEAIVENGTIKGVITESKSGRTAVLARRVVDCTGDADIAHRAGCRYRQLPKSEMMGVSTVFSVAGIDKERFLAYTEKNPATYADWSSDWDPTTSGNEDILNTPYLGKVFDTAKDRGIIPENVSIGGTWSALSDAGEATNLNLVYMRNYDATDVRDLTKAEMQGRRECMMALEALRAVVPGFENAKLRNFSMTLGVRDTRKIVGRYELTGDDVTGEARFDDSIGIFPEFLDGYNVLVLPTSGRYFQVPYGALVPLDVDNLLVAGRAVAGDKMSHTAMRNMMACTVTGQGAGAAAAVSAQTDKTTGTVDISAVQNELSRQGVRLS